MSIINSLSELLLGILHRTHLAEHVGGQVGTVIDAVLAIVLNGMPLQLTGDVVATAAPLIVTTKKGLVAPGLIERPFVARLQACRLQALRDVHELFQIMTVVDFVHLCRQVLHLIRLS